MSGEIEEIAKLALFRGMTEEEIVSVLPCLRAQIKKYPKNTVVFRESALQPVGIVLHGQIRLYREDAEGNRNVFTTLTEGEMFGEERACGSDALPLSGITATDSTLMFLDGTKLHTVCPNACERHRKIIENLLRTVSRKNSALTQKIAIISHRTTKEKVMAYLQWERQKHDSDVFDIPFDRQTLADYLGVERSAMSTEIGKLRDEGKILVDKRKFTILH